MPPAAADEYPRFRWLVPSTIAGAPHPDLNDGLAVVAPFLHAQGIGAIVTLYDKPLSPEPGSLGFQYLFVATPDFRPPPDLTHILSFIAEQVEQGRGVLVHCFAGIGRTGTVLAAWLLLQEPALTTAAAITRVRDCYIPEYARQRFPEHVLQEKALEQFAQSRGRT